MTTPDDNPYAPPSYPPPQGQAYSTPSFGDEAPPSGPAFAPDDTSTQMVGGLPTQPVRASAGPTNRSATRALWLALLTPVLTPVVGIAAVAVGRRSRVEIAQTGERGAGLAGAAIWIGAVFSILWTLGAAFLVAMKAGSMAA